METIFTHRTAAAALALAISSFTLVAVAGPANAAEVRVSLADAATLDARIERAAARACATGGRTLAELRFERLCIAQTLRDTRIQLAARARAPMTASAESPAPQS